MGLRETLEALDVLRRGCYLGGDLPGVDEVEGALATVRSEMERLREERDSWVETYLDRGRDLAAAEAEVRRLTDGLRELLDAFPMADPYGSLWEDCRKAQDKARALLSAGPLDGGGAK